MNLFAVGIASDLVHAFNRASDDGVSGVFSVRKGKTLPLMNRHALHSYLEKNVFKGECNVSNFINRR